jgi:hypothetical protein
MIFRFFSDVPEGTRFSDFVNNGITGAWEAEISTLNFIRCDQVYHQLRNFLVFYATPLLLMVDTIQQIN